MRLLLLVLLATGAGSSPAQADSADREQAPGPPRLTQLTGLDLRRLGDGARELRPAAAKRQPGELGQDGAGTAIAFAIRSAYAPTEWFAGGLELSFGFAEEGGDQGTFCTAGLVFGLQAAAGPLAGGAEIFGGVRGHDLERTRERPVDPMLEPRVTGELRLASDLALGARVGTDLLRRGDLLVGIYLQVTSRPYPLSLMR